MCHNAVLQLSTCEVDGGAANKVDAQWFNCDCVPCNSCIA